jgi:hypothetical protein
MANFMKFRWVRNPYKANYGAAFAVAFEAGMGAYTKGFAKRVEQYAKSNAPWADRTGAARDGLTAEGYFRLTQYTIVLYHTVDYGIWLEIRWNGRYAIIMPTIEAMGREFMGEIQMASFLKGLAT